MLLKQSDNLNSQLARGRWLFTKLGSIARGRMRAMMATVSRKVAAILVPQLLG